MSLLESASEAVRPILITTKERMGDPYGVETAPQATGARRRRVAGAVIAKSRSSWCVQGVKFLEVCGTERVHEHDGANGRQHRTLLQDDRLTGQGIHLLHSQVYDSLMRLI
jgi:hypothetical protein